ncbi:SseB family protein [Cryptosporangium aurantiacum]|uniref:SseB protein N-terminal domain-containing protein n=1 Tax=Cryptosporangium aurantiacum TaxID=134849 RepID=A0A1M7TXH2_9ACTN|nr:SseB family protein [Cryptosporangium aurantiacum]SHN75422.1 SseB protein N-terminal domain-containing protein [Cryptosporangium aurantiacum]
MAETEPSLRWRPANEPELLLYHALLRADTGRYFRVVTESPLYLAAVSAPERRLVTWERGGRTHLLAFTSPEGLARCLGTEADTVLRVDYPGLLRDWPNPDWWLALNPTLPIDAALPVGEVADAARGETEFALPVVDAYAGVPSLDPLPGAGGAPANDIEETMADVLAQGNVPLLLDLLVFADVLLPVLRPVDDGVALDDPRFPWAALPLTPDSPEVEPAIGVFTSEERLAEAAPGVAVPALRLPLLEVAAVWPGAEYALVVNPDSGLRARLPGDQVPALVEWARAASRYHGLEPV